MNSALIHVYLMPGMAASSSIFENIKLPENKFQIHLLEWFIPENNESLKDYAKRMCENIKHDNCVLIGVSFGGILVQEMSKYLSLKQLVLVSTVKTKRELPKRFKIAKATKAYKIAPTSLASKIDILAKYAFGKAITKRMDLYKKHLSVNDKRYLDWAIKEMVCWEQEKPLPNTIHIHGDNDMVFPHKNISDCITLKGGTHIMVINKYKWFNENLPKLILDEKVA